MVTDDDYLYTSPELVRHTTSYFGPVHGLDPRLFVNGKLKDWVADDIEMLVFDFFKDKLHLEGIEAWLHIWLAGSGVSFQWAGVEPSDLDCLIGIHWTQFRQTNGDFRGLTDGEIAGWLNNNLYTGLNNDHWNSFELTFYVNPNATDITNIHPYAAWDVTCGCWTVPPTNPPKHDQPAWAVQAATDESRTLQIVERFQRFATQVKNASNPAGRINGEVYLKEVLRQGADLYDEIHEARNSAFSLVGEGYASPENYRWQAAKASGVKDVLSQLKHFHSELEAKKYSALGVEMPSVDTLITRAALAGRRFG